MRDRAIFDRPALPRPGSDIVGLWRQAVLGDAEARRLFLMRIMPQSYLEIPPATIELPVPSGRERVGVEVQRSHVP